ncbi:hypothetical protein [Laceyella putida]|uniref:Uncharacterized protein n=1 Tax=Laceyella putida TaxID=110101 RepID=A0ABW2RLM6_9BACL
MAKQSLIVEKSKYPTLLYRKNRLLRLLESGVFALELLIVLSVFPFRSPGFIAGMILSAILAILIVPALYLWWAKPSYELYQDRLLVKVGGKEESIWLHEIEKEYDLPYMIRVKGKRIPLLVSDSFLEEINARLEVVRRGWKKS